MQKMLIATNLWVGLAVALLTFISFLPGPMANASPYALLVGFATVGAYGYMRWVQVLQQKGQDTLGHYWFKQHQIPATFILAFSLSTCVILLFRFFSGAFYSWLVPPALVVIFYPITFSLPLGSFSSLRALPGIKLLLISACWTYLTFAVPQFLQNASVGGYFTGEVIFRTLFIAALRP